MIRTPNSMFRQKTAGKLDYNMTCRIEGIARCCKAMTSLPSFVRLVPAAAAKSQKLAPADRIIAVGPEEKGHDHVVGWRLGRVVKG